MSGPHDVFRSSPRVVSSMATITVRVLIPTLSLKSVPWRAWARGRDLAPPPRAVRPWYARRMASPCVCRAASRTGACSACEVDEMGTLSGRSFGSGRAEARPATLRSVFCHSVEMRQLVQTELAHGSGGVSGDGGAFPRRTKTHSELRAVPATVREWDAVGVLRGGASRYASAVNRRPCAVKPNARRTRGPPDARYPHPAQCAAPMRRTTHSQQNQNRGKR